VARPPQGQLPSPPHESSRVRREDRPGVQADRPGHPDGIKVPRRVVQELGLDADKVAKLQKALGVRDVVCLIVRALGENGPFEA
jgi:hypothetical protein